MMIRAADGILRRYFAHAIDDEDGDADADGDADKTVRSQLVEKILHEQHARAFFILYEMSVRLDMPQLSKFLQDIATMRIASCVDTEEFKRVFGIVTTNTDDMLHPSQLLQMRQSAKWAQCRKAIADAVEDALC